MAKRAGFSWETYRRFEMNGHIQLDRLCRIARALGRLKDFALFLDPPPFETIEQMEASKATRQRGHTMRS